MSRVFLSTELEGVATFWRIHRTDGVALGFTSHDRDLRFAGVLHRAAPGMLPSAIRLTAGVDGDSAEIEGALAHDSIAADDLAAGRFDGARVLVGAVDWETGANAVLYAGTIGAITREDGAFGAELVPAKAALALDPVPRTSPMCRAVFCGAECGLSAARFSRVAVLERSDPDAWAFVFAGTDPSPFDNGSLRWIDGPHAGLAGDIVAVTGDAVVIDAALDPLPPPGTRAIVKEGCDRTLATCAGRFANAINFRGEPFLPGNDLLARHPGPA